MKKLMIAACAVAFAAAVQAAGYNWNMMTYASPDGENALAGTVYAFDANVNTYATIVAALEGGDTSVLGSALGSGVLEESFVSLTGDGLTGYSGTIQEPVPETASMYAIILSSDGNFFYGADVFDPVTISQAHKSGGNVIFGSDENLIVTGEVGTGNWKSIPEPTSGLLLLLGVAGLALKRKRA